MGHFVDVFLLSALTGVGIPDPKFSSVDSFLEMRIIHLMPYQKLSGGWCPSSLQGKPKIHSLLSSALFWPGSISRAGHDLKLKTLVIIGI